MILGCECAKKRDYPPPRKQVINNLDTPVHSFIRRKYSRLFPFHSPPSTTPIVAAAVAAGEADMETASAQIEIVVHRRTGLTRLSSMSVLMRGMLRNSGMATTADPTHWLFPNDGSCAGLAGWEACGVGDRHGWLELGLVDGRHIVSSSCGWAGGETDTPAGIRAHIG